MEGHSFRSIILCGAALLLAGRPADAGQIRLLAPKVPGNAPAALHSRNGFGFLHNGKLPEAEKEFQASLSADPKRVDALIGLAEVARERKQVSQEEAWLKKALAVDGGTALGYRAWAHYQAASFRLPEAETAFRKAAAMEPSSPDALLELGDLYLVAGKPAMAVKAYADAVKRSPASFDAHMAHGAALAGENQFEPAIAEYREAARLAPSSAAPLHSIGLAYSASGQRDKAIEAFGAAIRVNGRFELAWISRGDAWEAKGDAAKALADYNQALTLNPKAGIVKFKIGLVYLVSGRQEEARRAFTEAVQLDPGNADAWNNLAWIAAEKRTDLDHALEWARKAVQIGSGNPRFIDTLCWVYRARRELDLDAQTVEKFPGYDRSPELLYHLALVDSERGRKPEAIAALNKSLRLGDFPELADARKLLATLR